MDETDRRHLKPFRLSQVSNRMVYSVRIDGQTYTVDFDGTDWKAWLYVDRVLQAESDVPATFPVPGGVIEFDVGVHGTTRAHLVAGDGPEVRLTPDRGTLENLRAELGRRYPRLSRVIGGVAVLILVVDLILAASVALEMLTRVDRVRELLGFAFVSPIQLPAWAGIALALAGGAAAVERALTLRHHRFLDLDTTWTGLA